MINIEVNAISVSRYYINRSNVTTADRSFNLTIALPQKREKTARTHRVTSDDPTCQFNVNFEAANRRKSGFRNYFSELGYARSA